MKRIDRRGSLEAWGVDDVSDHMRTRPMRPPDFLSRISPMATPATGRSRGTPAGGGEGEQGWKRGHGSLG